MHSRAPVAEALRLRNEEGLGARRVARKLELPLGTVKDWHQGKLPEHSRPRQLRLINTECPRCGHEEHRFSELTSTYVYLLGLYLGDGSIARTSEASTSSKSFSTRSTP
jgi:hypothetical protein